METDNSAAALAAVVEATVAADVNGRGTAHLMVPGDLLAAAAELATAERVAIVTGFFIPGACAAETDGPPGALFLARALIRLGKEAVVLTDRWCRPVLDHPAMAPWVHGVPVIAVAPRPGDDWCRRHGITHLVSVERPGRAADGHYYSARGVVLDDCVAPLDGWFLERPPGVVTVGIGDGGNEIGMGKVLAQVRRHVPLGERIGSVVPADYVIAAGVSNWGAYALLALLAHLTRADLLPAPAEEAALVEALAAAGAVDGLSGRNVPAVDGQSLADLQEMLRRLHRETTAAARQVS
ncbi:MAG TPA: glutamate cyclase domain-containing protein [Limnochordales bacterium]